MNLVITSTLVLLVMLATTPTLIYGSRSTAGNGNTRKQRSPSTVAKLVMAMESGDILVRSARQTETDAKPAVAATPTTHTNDGSSSGGGKRQKQNNKKLNKNLMAENEQRHTVGQRKRTDKKFSAAVNQQHGHNNNNNSRGNKQRQMLKSQQHSEHAGKRNGAGKMKQQQNGENGEKSKIVEKSPSTCRYAKSAWTDCDAKTNMRSRTLTLKKGEANCLQTRTMQKKCKKSCRYEKGAWSECSAGQMTRQDKLKSTGSSLSVDSSCEPMRSITKKCGGTGAGAGAGKQQGGGGGKANKERKNKDKAARRAPPA